MQHADLALRRPRPLGWWVGGGEGRRSRRPVACLCRNLQGGLHSASG